MHLIQFLDRIPPNICRLLARKKSGRAQSPMTCNDIATASGISRTLVVQISSRKSWKGMSIDSIQRFSLACGVNLVSETSNHKQFVLHRAKAVLNNANARQRRMIERIISESGIEVIR